MDSLTEEIWDVVIVGTSLPQSLLALSLSRSKLNILHVDSNKYYGGIDAGLSLDEAQRWATEHKDDQHTIVNAAGTKLSPSKSYTLSLNPQIIYASSPFLPSMVTSRIHDQLDFLAVGSWWIYRGDRLDRIPSTREDVFADESLSRRDKMGLMKFLRSVVQDGSTEPGVEVDTGASLQDTLSSSYKIPTQLQSALAALALTPQSIKDTSYETAVKRVRRHMTSMGYFGPGFAAVYPKYAGSAEISQVGCRAGAVGGAVYLLHHGVTTIDASATSSDTNLLSVQLTNTAIIQARYIAGDVNSLPANTIPEAVSRLPSTAVTLRSTMIISSSLKHLFQQTADNSPIPAVTIVFIDDSKDNASSNTELLPPIYLQIHSEDTGECPSGQCIIYASLHLANPSSDLQSSRDRLEAAIQTFLTQESTPQAEPAQTVNLATGKIEILWSMSYITTGLPIDTILQQPFLQDDTGRIVAFPSRTQDAAFDDQILSSVKAIWTKIMGDKPDAGEFMCFEDRNREDQD